MSKEAFTRREALSCAGIAALTALGSDACAQESIAQEDVAEAPSAIEQASCPKFDPIEFFAEEPFATKQTSSSSRVTWSPMSVCLISPQPIAFSIRFQKSDDTTPRMMRLCAAVSNTHFLGKGGAGVFGISQIPYDQAGPPNEMQLALNGEARIELYVADLLATDEFAVKVSDAYEKLRLRIRFGFWNGGGPVTSLTGFGLKDRWDGRSFDRPST